MKVLSLRITIYSEHPEQKLFIDFKIFNLMDYIFEVIDKSGRKIYLTKERWTHITIKHWDMSNKLDEIKNTLRNPTLIVPHKYDDSMRNYYWFYKLEKEYLLVSVKYLNGNGFVATAFITKKIIRR